MIVRMRALLSLTSRVPDCRTTKDYQQVSTCPEERHTIDDALENDPDRSRVPPLWDGEVCFCRRVHILVLRYERVGMILCCNAL